VDNSAGSKLGLTIDLIAGGMALLVMFTLPLAFFLIKHEKESASMETRAKMYAGLIMRELPPQWDTANAKGRGLPPNTRKILNVNVAYAGQELRSLKDLSSGEVIVSGKIPDTPLLSRSADVMASALPVARVEITHSLRPLLMTTALVGVMSLSISFGVFVLLRAYPLRALSLAKQELDMRQMVEGKLQNSLSVLEATLESTADGILVLNAKGSIMSFNDRFLEMWQMPVHTRADDAFEILTTIKHSVTNPDQFLDRLRQFSEAPPAGVEKDGIIDVLELTDGRAFEVISIAQRIEGNNTGWVMSFHDVSERRRNEALLAREKQVLEMILTGEELEKILGFLVLYLEKQARQMFCAIFIPNLQGRLQRAAGTYLPNDFIDAKWQAGMMASLSEPGHSLNADILEVRSHSMWSEYNQQARKLGIQPWWAAPILSFDGDILGIIVAHYRTSFQPDPKDANLLALTADLTKIVLERKHAESRLEYLAHFDELTGLPNRSLFSDRLSHAMNRAERDGELLGVMLLDLDRFKNINDTLGHAEGDKLLRDVASRLETCMREGDTVARLGGDEFTVILEGISSPDDAAMVARKIIDTLAPPFLLGESEVFVTASIGISIFPLDSTDPDILLKNTDTAMYSAKETGRNNFQFFTQAMNARTQGRLEMESDLQHALEREEFVIYYQPKISLSDGEALGMEALIRWRHPDRGIVPPDAFIPILEDTGLINPVGKWLLQTACTQTKRWQEKGLPPMRIAVNVSPRQFLHNDLVADVTHALETSRLDADWLELEITESLLMQNPDYAASVMEKIRSLGVIRIDIDDFGTGYSSLGYLKRFPIHTVKIDASFVRDILVDREDSAIVQAVIAMSHSLGLKVIAEGVETQEQYELLRKLECDAVQGYLIGHPMPAEDCERWIATYAGSASFFPKVRP